MVIWRASKAATATIRVWFGGNGIGDMALSQLTDTSPVLLGRNVEVGHPMTVQLPMPADGRLAMQLRVILGTTNGADAPVFVTVEQNGVPLQGADVLTGPFAGQFPAKYNVPTWYQLYVAFQ